MPSPDLHAVLAWTQDAVCWGSTDPSESCDAWVLPSATLEARERVAIYRRMIAIRGYQTLLGLFPRLHGAMGAEAFRRLAGDYLAARGSRSFTLARLGDALPEFLLSWTGGAGDPVAAWSDLARYERARTTARRAPAPRPLDAAARERLESDEAGSLALVPAPGLQLLRLDHPVHEAGPTWLRRPTVLAVHRTPAGVGVLALERTEDAVLSGLLRGDTLGRIVERVGAPDAALRRFLASGLFVDVRSEPS